MLDIFFARVLHRQYCVIVSGVMSACLFFVVVISASSFQKRSLPGSITSLGIAKLWHSNSVIPSSFISWNTFLKKTCHQLFVYTSVHPSRKGRIKA